MVSTVFWRRAATAGGVYGAAVVGFLATVVSARLLGKVEFAQLTLVIATMGFLQTLLDLTVDEALVKYGFRYIARDDFGRFRRLFRIAWRIKVVGGLLGAAAVIALAPLGDAVFGEDGLLVPLLIAAAIPLAQAPEGLAGSLLILRRRTDVRAAFLLVSMTLRLAGIGVGAAFGVWQAVLGMAVAQVAATAAIGLAGVAAYRRFPSAPAEPLGDDGRPLRSFVIQSSIGTGIASARTSFPVALIGLVTGANDVANFRAAQAPQGAFQSLSAPARLVLLAEQTHDFEHGRFPQMRAMLRRYMVGTTAILLVVTPVLWWLMPDLMRIVYGAEYEGAANATRLILLAAAVQVIFGWTKPFPVSIGRPKLRIVTQGIEVAVLIPLLLVLGSIWGATGAAAAVVVGTAVFAAAWTVILVRLLRGQLAIRPPATLTPLTDEAVAP